MLLKGVKITEVLEAGTSKVSALCPIEFVVERAL